MNPNPAIMKSVEKLDYRVTVGDVASQTGLEIAFAQQELLNLASSANGHLQVAETGDILYLFPQNFRTVLLGKYWRLRFKNWLQGAWKTIFYLIRISFGIILILSIVLILLAILAIIVASSSSRSDNNNNRSSRGGGMMFLPNFWFSPNMFTIFSPRYNQRYRQTSYSPNNQLPKEKSELNFLESIYSFLFGDGNPNPNLEERRWQEIATVIQQNKGAIIAEQLAPYLDNINIYNERDEDYMLPVLTRFNGYPEVSEVGDIIYYFPELQIKANEAQNKKIEPYLQENLWQFSIANSQQKIMAFGLGGVNLILALVLGSMLTPELIMELGSLAVWVNPIYNILLIYGVSYLVVPLVRYFWLQTRNKKVVARNDNREQRANFLKENKETLQPKIDYARQFATQKILTREDVIYSTDKDMLDNIFEGS